MARRWRTLILCAAAFVLVIALCPTLRYTTRWQFKAIRRAALPPRFLTPPGQRMAGTLWFHSDHVSEFLAPSLGDVASALKKHPEDWRLAAGVALLLEEPPFGMFRGTRIKPHDLQHTAFEQAIAANPDSAPLRGWAATVYIGRAFELRRRYTRAARKGHRDIESAEARIVRPEYLAHAEKHLRAAAGLEGDNGFYDQLLAYVWLLREQPDRAVESLERALGKPKWTTHSTGMLELADHALVSSGADPLAARIVRGQVVLWPPRRLFWLHSEFGGLIWSAAQAGDAGRAIRIYRPLIGLASRIRQTGNVYREGMWMPDVFQQSMLTPFDLGPFRASTQRITTRLPSFYRNYTAARVREHEWYNYLRAHGYADLAVFAMAERAILDSFPYRDMRREGDPGPALDWGARLWTVQAWVTGAIMLTGLALLALWMPRLFPSPLRGRVTLAGQNLFSSSPAVRALPPALAYLPLGVFIAIMYWAAPRTGERPELLGVITMMALLVVLTAAALLIALRLGHLRLPGPGFPESLVRFVRGLTLWLVNALLMLWLALSAPLYISARVGVDKLTAMQEMEMGVRGPVPMSPVNMPAVPGPDPTPQR